MDMKTKENFIGLWQKYFNKAELPIAFYYTDETGGVEVVSDHPRAVLGMFDVSARPFVSGEVLSFSVPMNKFVTMIGNMEESFLITQSWSKVQKRIG